MDSSPGHSLFVGDSEIDVATAKAAGVVCWAVPYGYNHGRPIALADPDRVVPDISDVPNYFRGI
jgi:phosphoglycolate phosphatase